MALLHRLMMTAWDMWNHRNKALHEQDENKQEILEAAVNQNIREAYELGVSSLPTDAHSLLKRSLRRLLNLSVEYKHQWLASVAAAKARLVRQRSRSPGQIRNQRKEVSKSIRRLAGLL